jgi:hypothetical protein
MSKTIPIGLEFIGQMADEFIAPMNLPEKETEAQRDAYIAGALAMIEKFKERL